MTNLDKAIEIAKAKTANNAAWSRSVEKAAAALLSGELIATPLVNGGIVTSPCGTYRIKNGRCSCAGSACGHCYHISALRIVDLADELTTTPAPATVSTMPERQRLIANIEARVEPMALSRWLQKRLGVTLITSPFIAIADLRIIHEALCA